MQIKYFKLTLIFWGLFVFFNTGYALDDCPDKTIDHCQQLLKQECTKYSVNYSKDSRKCKWRNGLCRPDQVCKKT